LRPAPTPDEVKNIFGDGAGKQQELVVEPLSQINEGLNERFGLNLDDTDQLLFDQFEETWTADPELAAQARDNTLDDFRLVFDPKFLNTIVTRMDARSSNRSSTNPTLDKSSATTTSARSTPASEPRTRPGQPRGRAVQGGLPLAAGERRRWPREDAVQAPWRAPSRSPMRPLLAGLGGVPPGRAAAR
jgi:hypothetical protein